MLYIIHFDEKIADHAQHYSGYAADVEARLAQHMAGYGARLTQVARERGIKMRLAATFEGSYGDEKALKAQHNAPRYCPICRQQKLLEKMGL